jgi:CRP-like cAMP-binding protein
VDIETSRGYLGQLLEVSIQSLKDPAHVRVRNVENALDPRIVKVHPAKADGSMPITKQEIVNMLDSTSWAKDFTRQQILSLCDYLTVCHAHANEPIYNEGDVGDSMSILIKGTAKVYKANKASTELKADRTFGEMLLFDNERRSANIVAVDPCTFLSMDKTSFDLLSK